MLITWSEDLRTGDSQIDHQHMYLIEQANRLQQMLEKQGGGAESERVLLGLTRYVSRHFRDEEKIMAENSFPGQEEHIRQHVEFARAVEAFLERQARGEKVAAMNLLIFLKHWFVNHIRTYDLELAGFTQKKHGVGRLPPIRTPGN